MKLSHLQLAQHVKKNLAPLYFISSDETLLAQEAADTIRAAAIQAGYTERVSITPESGTEWEEALYANSHNLSLFSSKKIIDLNLCLLKFGAAHGKILADMMKNPVPDTIIIVRTTKLDSKTEKSAWYQTLDKTAITLPIWPLSKDQLPAWITQRAKSFKMDIEKEAAERLATLVEGNLLAAAQEIEKLSLLQPNSIITHDIIETTVTDHAHFDIFILVDSALTGDNKRSIRILQSLLAEDMEPTLILWAFLRELRTLADILQQQKKGLGLSQLFSQFRIWEKRQPAIRAFLQRHTLESCWGLFLQASQIDRLIKGADKGNISLALEKFLFAV